MKRWLAAAVTLSLLTPGPVFAQSLRAPLVPAGAPASVPLIAAPAASLPSALALPQGVPALAPQAAQEAAAEINAAPAAEAQVQALGRAVVAEGAKPATALDAAFDKAKTEGEAPAPVIVAAAARRSAPSLARYGYALAPGIAAAAPVAAHSGSGVLSIIGLALPIVIMVGLMIYQIRRNRNLGAVDRPFKKPAADSKAEPESKVMFDDVAGQEEAKTELQRVVRFLKNPERYTKINPRAKPFKGLLFFGPPGTGKTMLARALANEAGAAFVTRKGSDFVNVYVGKGAANIRAAFEEVRAKAKGGPGILFIDEIDAVGHKRSEGDKNNDSGEDDKAITALLAEMDGFEKDNIIVIAATNRPDKLDPALLRGGRFGLKIPVGLPDVEGRLAVLKVHTKEMVMAEDVDLKAVAKQTPGLAGADLEHVVQRAGILAGDEGADKAYMRHFATAVDEMTIGQQRRLVMSEEEKRVVTYHESGHALVSHLLPNADPVRKVTIIPHGLNALGLMQAMPEEEKNIQSREWLLDRMAVAMGGRAGEELMTGKIYSGASNDFEQATRIARYMVTKFGMSPLGYAAYDLQGANALEFSEDYKQKVEAEVNKLLNEAMERARKILTENKDVLEAMAVKLREKETLRGDEIEALIPSNKKGGPSGPQQLLLNWLGRGLSLVGGFSPMLSLAAEWTLRASRHPGPKA